MVHPLKEDSCAVDDVDDDFDDDVEGDYLILKTY